MIVLTAVFKAKTGMESTLEKILSNHVPRVGSEKGILAYILHRAQNDSGTFMFYEKYADKPSMEAHMGTPSLKEMLAAVGPILSNRPTISFYDEISALAR